MVVLRRQLHDPVSEADVFGPLARGGEKDLGRGRVRVLLEEVVLHLPNRVQPQLVRELNLFEGIQQQLLLGALRMRPRQLVLVKQPESHARSILTVRPGRSFGNLRWSRAALASVRSGAAGRVARTPFGLLPSLPLGIAFRTAPLCRWAGGHPGSDCKRDAPLAGTACSLSLWERARVRASLRRRPLLPATNLHAARNATADRTTEQVPWP